MAAAVLTLQYETAQPHRISSHPSEAKIKKRKGVRAAAVCFVFAFIFVRQKAPSLGKVRYFPSKMVMTSRASDLNNSGKKTVSQFGNLF